MSCFLSHHNYFLDFFGLFVIVFGVCFFFFFFFVFLASWQVPFKFRLKQVLWSRKPLLASLVSQPHWHQENSPARFPCPGHILLPWALSVVTAVIGLRCHWLLVPFGDQWRWAPCAGASAQEGGGKDLFPHQWGGSLRTLLDTGLTYCQVREKRELKSWDLLLPRV